MGGTGNKLGAPEHRKYIKENTKGEDYTLTLDVIGERGQSSGIDVLLVIDTSGSMGEWPGGSNNPDSYFKLLPDLKTTVSNTIVPAVLPDNASINSISAVSFSSKGYSSISTDWVSYENRSSIIESVNSLSANGGTNWELAMIKAEQKLSERTSNNQKVVIFLSDGAPGFYYNDNGEEQGIGSPSNDTQIKTARDQAVNYVTGSNYLKNSTIYSVYLTGGDTQSSMTTFADDLKEAGINATAVNG